MYYRPIVYGLLVGVGPLLLLFLFWSVVYFGFLCLEDADSYRPTPVNHSQPYQFSPARRPGQ
jgi:hypothetical protein